MLTERDLIARVEHLTVTRLRIWVRQGWIMPADEAQQAYSEADLARAALIRDLEDELGFAGEDVHRLAQERPVGIAWLVFWLVRRQHRHFAVLDPKRKFPALQFQRVVAEELLAPAFEHGNIG